MRSLALAVILAAALAAGAWLLGAPEPAVSAAYAEAKRGAAEAEPPPAIWQDMAVAQAYGAIPHRRTAFRADRSNLSIEDARYLEALFALTDAGVVERVATRQALLRGAGGLGGPSNYEAILQAVAALETPEKLRPVEGLIFDAIAEQRRYLAEWRASGSARFFDRGAPLVRSSHGKLIAAYERLMTLYAGEDRHNKQAFFDHLCALDFI